jgi:adenosyl cobinamide kinase/adenosyl cobinamide phosphate guanylyltransferase
MVDIQEEYGNTSILKSKSLRDEVISDKIPIKCGLSRTSAIYLVVGTCGSGKSFWAESIFKKQLKKAFDGIWLFCPRSSRSGYKDSYCKKMNPTRVYDELSEKNLKTVLEEVKTLNSEGDKNDPRFSALIIDDCASSLRNKHTQKLLHKTLANHRHQRLSVFILVQNLQSIHISLRNLMTVLVQFKTSSLKEVKAINDEFLPQYTPEEVREILHYIYKDKYSYLLVNRRDGYICKSFNPLTITTDRDL